MRKQRLLVVALALCASWLVVSDARGSFVQLPLETVVDQAALIVEGKVVRIEPNKLTRPFGNMPRAYDLAVVEVADVLRGPAKIKEVRIAQPALGGGLAVSTDIRFAVGQQGVWMLNKEKEPDVFWATHPSQFEPVKEKERIAKVIAARAKITVGKEVKGLAAFAEAIKREGDYTVRFSVKNVSKEPIVLFDFVGSRPVEVVWTGPDGKKLETDHYKWLEAVRLRAPNKDNFFVLHPGTAVRFGGRGRGDDLGIALPNPRPGKHTVSVRYVNREDGKEHGVQGVWVGTLAAPDVVIDVQ